MGQVFSCEFYQILKFFFTEHLQANASVYFFISKDELFKWLYMGLNTSMILRKQCTKNEVFH